MASGQIARFHFEFLFVGVYRHPTQVSFKEAQPHAVRIIGWGEANGEPYWIIANTWGKDWGRSRGFLKLLKGRDELGAESIVIFAKPALGTSSSPDRFCVSVELFSFCFVFLAQLFY
jgi:hypothetical protein